jgi:hypothetical protein
VKESDYIAAQNLWRARQALEMVRGMVFLSRSQRERQGELTDLLYKWEMELSKALENLR